MNIDKQIFHNMCFWILNQVSDWCQSLWGVCFQFFQQSPESNYEENLAVKTCLGTNGQLLANNQPAVSQQSTNWQPTVFITLVGCQSVICLWSVSKLLVTVWSNCLINHPNFSRHRSHIGREDVFFQVPAKFSTSTFKSYQNFSFSNCPLYWKSYLLKCINKGLLSIARQFDMLCLLRDPSRNEAVQFT